MAVRPDEGVRVVGFPQRAGDALIRATSRFKVPKVPKVSDPHAKVRVKLPRKPKEPSRLY